MKKDMKTSAVFIDKSLELEGEIGLWADPAGNPLNQFAIIDEYDQGTHSMAASLNMVARNIGVGKRVRLKFEVIE